MFTISDVSKKDAGRYSCSYTSVRQPYLLSEPSNPVELLLTDPQLPRPIISISSRKPFSVGKDVTIVCEIAEGPATVYLHKAGELRKWARDSYANVTEFYFRKITMKDKGNYSCCWAKLRSPFLVSNRSHLLELSVLDDASLNQISNYAQINQSLVVVSGILVFLVFLLLSAAFFWFKGKSNSIQQATQSSDEPSFRVMKRHRVSTPASTLAVGWTRIHKQLPKHDAPTETEDIIYADLKREAPHTQEEARSYDGSEDLVYAAVFQHNSKGVQAQMEDK
ncbi:immunoglobulin superfamily member 1-like [Podarcis lilfordi]|nr:immunoglobulin superfamily member 1-like [Podarcis lilfordi]